MAQKTQRACGAPISAGLKNADEIAYSGRRNLHFARQGIQRRAKRADHIDDFSFGVVELIDDRHREISFDDLTEIAARRKVVVHAAVENQKFFSARDFDVINPGNIYARFTH